ncbi:MAG: hypothetical protein MUE53_02805 [Chitinophagales bacterium]|jgi:hypothetical protein|nr:hypothetical protein [Chitinophagales bacterium]
MKTILLNSKILQKSSFGLGFIFFVFFAQARESVSVDKSKTNNPQTLTQRVGDCIAGAAQTDLNINNVRARMLNTGDMWWDRNTAKYGVPKLTQDQIRAGFQQVNALFSGALWISGLDNAGALRVAALRFSSSGADFFPGTLNSQNLGDINRAKCLRFDQHFNVFGSEIKEFIATQGGTVSDNIKYWPGLGNPHLISDKGFNESDLNEVLAPFYDANDDGIYNYEDGDYPSVNQVSSAEKPIGVIADQMIFWVTNDFGNQHTNSQGAPLSIQINNLAFAYATSDELNNMTFYKYEVINKSGVNYNQTYISQYVDPDMGNYNDDYVGCDTTHAVGYVYNADAIDEDVTQAKGYGTEKIPVVGVDFFQGPKDDITNQPLGMSSFVYFVNSSGNPLSDPSTATEYRNFQRGNTRQGNPMTLGGNCTGGTVPTRFCFPGNPANSTEWSMCSAAIPKGDVRWVQTSGPFTFETGSVEDVIVGVVFDNFAPYDGCKVDINRSFLPADEKAQRLFDANFENIAGPDAPELTIISGDGTLNFNINNIKNNNVSESYSVYSPPIPRKPSIVDSTYKFEGYLIYQVSDPSKISTINDLSNQNLARQVKKMDVRNSVSGMVYNLRADRTNPLQIVLIPSYSIELDNRGIERNFSLREDLFESEGNKFLVNNKTYYYAVVAFAYNNYVDGQDVQLEKLKFSPTIKIFSAIPQKLDGFVQGTRAKFGEELPIKRIQGYGSGSFYIEPTDSSVAKIIQDGSLLELDYQAGFAPIKVTVVDPFQLKNHAFRLLINDSSKVSNSDRLRTDSSSWTLEVLDDNNDVVETIYSERNISRPFTQTIVSNSNNVQKRYGLSISVPIADSLAGYRSNSNPVYGVHSATIEYEDNLNKWFYLFKDEDRTNYNWIRAGQSYNNFFTSHSSFNRVGNTIVYSDPTSKFEGILDKGLAPYCLTANSSITEIPAGSGRDNPLADALFTSFGPGFKWRYVTSRYLDSARFEGPENNLDSLISFNLVITPDKNKWSQCVVLETGEFATSNIGGARKGQIRQSESVDADGNIIPGEIGRGYFPGYAINVETGERVNVYFGENSSIVGTYGANMKWDPSRDTITPQGVALLGGSHFVYITNSRYDGGQKDQQILVDNFNKTSGTGRDEILNPAVAQVYKSFAWTFIPILNRNLDIYNDNGVYTIPSKVSIKVRVSKPFTAYDGNSPVNDKTLIYGFDTRNLTSQKKSNDALSEAFQSMKVVPNPYNAYSIYENTPIQNLVKIVGVPDQCKISIYTIDGVLVRTLSRDYQESLNQIYAVDVSGGKASTENAITWDLRTNAGVLISSGVYNVLVESAYGTKNLKFFCTMRSPDVSNF